MTARAFDIDDGRGGIRGRHTDTARFPGRYRIDVISSSVEDVVASAGGLLFDRAMSGWDVNVLVSGPSDVRALQILGIGTPVAEPTVVSVTKRPRTQALAVAAELFETDEQVRDTVLAALDRGLTEVTLWGGEWPAGLRHRANNVAHRLSSAARAFKAHALMAAALPPRSATAVERFCSGSRSFPPYEPDLLPV